jgi:hypothetical protein
LHTPQYFQYVICFQTPWASCRSSSTSNIARMNLILSLQSLVDVFNLWWSQFDLEYIPVA